MAEGRILPTLKETGQMLLTFFLVVLGWILFRSTGMSSCVQYILRIFDTSLFSIPWLLNKEFFMSLFLFILAMLVVEWLQRGKGHGLEMINEKRFAWLRWLVYYSIIILLIRYGMGEEKTFIYFQF